MRATFGILCFCTAGLLAFQIAPVLRQVVLPNWLLGKNSGGYVQMQLGPFLLDEPQICMAFALLALLVIALIVTGVYAFTSRDTAV